MTARFAASSITPVDASTETYNVGVQGQPVPIVPTLLPHPHAVFTPTHPPQFQQVLNILTLLLLFINTFYSDYCVTANLKCIT